MLTFRGRLVEFVASPAAPDVGVGRVPRCCNTRCSRTLSVLGLMAARRSSESIVCSGTFGGWRDDGGGGGDPITLADVVVWTGIFLSGHGRSWLVGAALDIVLVSSVLGVSIGDELW